MAKRKKKKEKETSIENFYDLRTDAVDDLVEALRTGESKDEVSTDIVEITGEQIDAKPGSKKAQFDPYRRDVLSNIPVWLKSIFIKWWFAGCVCYFIMMGLGAYIASSLDLMFLTGLALGIVVDIFVNPIFHYLESPEKEYDSYMMFPFPFKAFWTFFTNILYYLVVILLVNFVTNLINLGSLTMWLSPLVFATLTTLIDMAFIGIKDLIVYLVKRSKKKKALENGEVEIGFDGQPVPQMPKAEGRRKGGKGKQSDVEPYAEGTQMVEAKTDGEGDLAAPVSSGEADGGEELDEVERLRRLAESNNGSSENNGKNKNKKK